MLRQRPSGTPKPIKKGVVVAGHLSFLAALPSYYSYASEQTSDKNGPLGLTTQYEPQARAPVSAVADVVFIHGLGGGSRKTWSYSNQLDHYWPRTWLPADPDFANVRIHAFGYETNWGSHAHHVLDIDTSAQLLLNALRNHPAISKTRTRVILVGHCTGGSVAKKTYVLAREDPAAADLAQRIHSMFFLATPHRGSDMATILENILTVSLRWKRHGADLTSASATLVATNNAFSHVASQLRLWSFYETLPTRGRRRLMRRIVVGQHSATLGYANEEVAAMDADHRHVCKFDTPADPNYKMLRNALLTAVDMIRAELGGQKDAPESSVSSESANTSSLPLLRCFLGVCDPFEGDLATLRALKQPGSCEWFTKKDCFDSWRAGAQPAILWVLGDPGTGKSVLSGHVIEQLRTHAHCSYFICNDGEPESTLSHCFRSLAFQMAMQDNLVMGKLLRVAQDGLAWDKTSGASAWQHLFTRCIFKLPSTAQHFWVIDGIDKCANFNDLFTKRLLSALPDGIRLFATSRSLEQIERGLASLGPTRASVQVLSCADTLEDMRLYIATRLAELGRPESAVDRDHMCERILDGASGSFLWARLMLQELERAWTMEAMHEILSAAPAELSDFYPHIVRSIETDDYKLRLSRLLLTWVALARRPLTVDELRCAIKLQIHETLLNPEKVIPALCGQLVFIDPNHRVQAIHETARESILGPGHGPKQDGHARLASLLLSTCLSTIEQERRDSVTEPSPGASSLVDYACTFFSEHLYEANPADSRLMDDLYNFLRTSDVFS